MEETKFALIIGGFFTIEVLQTGVYLKIGNNDWFLEK